MSPFLIIFGGSFDPPHRGHLRCLELALGRFPQARIFVMPALVPGAVAGLEKQPGASFADRLRMCELMRAELPAKLMPQVLVSDLEESLPVPNRTLATLEALARLYPATELALLLGEDQRANFHLWHKPKEILARCSLLLVGRPPLGESRHRAEDDDGATLYFLGESEAPVASKNIRHPHNAEAAKDLLPWQIPAVQQYIKTKGLYLRKKHQ